MNYMSYNEFVDFVDNAVKDYVNDDWDVEDIQDFLDSQCGDPNFYRSINPMYVIREVNKCNMNCDITDFNAKHGTVTLRFRVLLGIIECIECCNRPKPKPKFKTYDIIQNLVSGETLVVMDFSKDRFVKGANEEDVYDYWMDNHRGNTVIYRQQYVEKNFKKIGEVTKDVIDKFLK